MSLNNFLERHLVEGRKIIVEREEPVQLKVLQQDREYKDLNSGTIIYFKPVEQEGEIYEISILEDTKDVKRVATAFRVGDAEWLCKSDLSNIDRTGTTMLQATVRVLSDEGIL